MIEIKNCILMQCDKPSRNGHIYPKSVMVDALTKFYETQLGMPIFGQLGEVPNNQSTIELAKVSHKIENVRFVENDIVGDITVLNTPCGETAQGILKSGTNLYCCPWGYGEIGTDGEIRNFTLAGINLNSNSGFDVAVVKLK